MARRPRRARPRLPRADRSLAPAHGGEGPHGRPAPRAARRRGPAQRGVGTVPGPHRHRGRHPRRRHARPGRTSCSPSSTSWSRASTRKLRMPADAMTARMVAAVANPHTDILGHCTGRLVVGRGRPESTFDADLVFAACAHFDTAVEINCRPERLDPPMRLLEQGRRARRARWRSTPTPTRSASSTWQPYGCDPGGRRRRSPADRVVNTWPVDRLLAWTAGPPHRRN